jgi:hypothetical protein
MIELLEQEGRLDISVKIPVREGRHGKQEVQLLRGRLGSHIHF